MRPCAVPLVPLDCKTTTCLHGRAARVSAAHGAQLLPLLLGKSRKGGVPDAPRGCVHAFP